jgi:hypothetical protein
LVKGESRLPLQGSANGGVGVAEGLETRLEATGAEDVGEREFAEQNGSLHGADKLARQQPEAIRDGDADGDLPGTAEIFAGKAPGGHGLIIDNVEGLAGGRGGGPGEGLGAVLDIG